MKPYKRGDPLAVLGMSGVGKTRIASMLRAEERWFHYSVDYRIGTRYMDEAIEDNFKREAMKAPLLRELLLSDSIYISSNITFDNLEPLSTYLGKPGDPAKGGIPFDEYVRRQRQHREGEEHRPDCGGDDQRERRPASRAGHGASNPASVIASRPASESTNPTNRSASSGCEESARGTIG